MEEEIRIRRSLIPKIVTNPQTVKNVFIGTYPPVKCGIATFTKDLSSAINLLNPAELAKIIAVTPTDGKIKYPWEVTFEVHQEQAKDYLAAAEYINKNKFGVVCLQHEYGIFGGEDGEQILLLVRNINAPLVITLHTVMKTPTENQRRVLGELVKIAKIVAVISQVPKRRLTETYGIDPGKIVIIPHGIPDLPFSPSEPWKRLLGASDKFVIGSFGLLSPNKGFEYLIKALPAVLEKHPKVVVLIGGETHPKIKLREGERYRESLMALAEKLGVRKKVFFWNKYLPLDELTYVIQAMDIYVSPYTNPQQISSGALAYAIGCGRACIATPFAYAKELLKENRGIIVPFKNATKLAQAINFLIENRQERLRMAYSSYLLGRKMTWVKVADTYLDLFRFLKTVYGKQKN